MSLRHLNICFISDLNAIIGSHEQIGQTSLHKLSCEEFSKFISEAGLIDLETSGPFFTWRSCHTGPILSSRLDMALVSDNFISSWAEIVMLFLPRVNSAHQPILFRCKGSSSIWLKPFRFQNFWASDATLKKVVADSWSVHIYAPDPITVLCAN